MDHRVGCPVYVAKSVVIPGHELDSVVVGNNGASASKSDVTVGTTVTLEQKTISPVPRRDPSGSLSVSFITFLISFHPSPLSTCRSHPWYAMGEYTESHASGLPVQFRAELAHSCVSIRFKSDFLANPMMTEPPFPGEGDYSLLGGSEDVDYSHRFHGCLWSEG